MPIPNQRREQLIRVANNILQAHAIWRNNQGHRDHAQYDPLLRNILQIVAEPEYREQLENRELQRAMEANRRDYEVHQARLRRQGELSSSNENAHPAWDKINEDIQAYESVRGWQQYMTPSLVEYLKRFRGKPSFSAKYNELELKSEEIGVLSQDVPDVPVKMNGVLYDWLYLREMFANEYEEARKRSQYYKGNRNRDPGNLKAKVNDRKQHFLGKIVHGNELELLEIPFVLDPMSRKVVSLFEVVDARDVLETIEQKIKNGNHLQPTSDNSQNTQSLDQAQKAQAELSRLRLENQKLLDQLNKLKVEHEQGLDKLANQQNMIDDLQLKLDQKTEAANLLHCELSKVQRPLSENNKCKVVKQIFREYKPGPNSYWNKKGYNNHLPRFDNLISHALGHNKSYFFNNTGKRTRETLENTFKIKIKPETDTIDSVEAAIRKSFDSNCNQL